jgi:hypothetical protein
VRALPGTKLSAPVAVPTPDPHPADVDASPPPSGGA